MKKILLAIAVSFILVSISACDATSTTSSSISPQQTQDMIDQETINLMGIVAYAKNLFGDKQGPGKYDEISNYVMVLSHSVPASMVVNAHPSAAPDKSTKLQSAWGGPVSITPIPGTDQFSVNYEAVPPVICLELVANTIYNLHQIQVNGTALPYDSTTNRKTVSAACESDPSGVARMNFISK